MAATNMTLEIFFVCFEVTIIILFNSLHTLSVTFQYEEKDNSLFIFSFVSGPHFLSLVYWQTIEIITSGHQISPNKEMRIPLMLLCDNSLTSHVSRRTQTRPCFIWFKNGSSTCPGRAVPEPAKP